MNATCARCQRPTADGTACTSCTTRAHEQLTATADLTPAARDVAHGQTRRGPAAAGDTGPRLPLNLAATQRLDAIRDQLTTWCSRIARERGIIPPWLQPHGDPIVAAARWLTGHLEWARHRAEVADLLVDVDACHRVVLGIARGPVDHRYLGPCGADLDAAGAQPDTISGHCEGDVYARDGARTGTCRTCGATVDTTARQAWLDGEVRQRAFRASQIADAYRVNVNTIRSWAARGQLVAHGHDQQDRPLYNVGDVLDLAAADAARRATDQAKRARRAAAKAAADNPGDAA